MKLLIFFCLSSILSFSAFSQQTKVVSGSITDLSGSPLTDVSVNLKSATENLTTKPNELGKYRFTSVASTQFVISITGIGYQDFSQSYIIANTKGNAFVIDGVKMGIKSSELSAVVITASPITIREDTVEFRASAYKVREGAPVEEVLKKLPGVTVEKDGTVTAQGKEIKRVRVNGKDYFGGDVQTATQNLPADIIENIQIIDDYGDKANMTGIKEGEPEKILNINIQRGKNKGRFGNATAGAGTEKRYLGTVAANIFNESRQISFLGAINNTNAQTFNFNGGGRGGGARGANFGSSERGRNADGITLSSSFGMNYRDMWGKKITSYGSYSFSSRSNGTYGTSLSQDYNLQNINTTRRVTDNNSSNYNHRLTWNLEYRIDTMNYLKVSPYYSYAGGKNSNNGVTEFFRPKYYTLNNGRSNSSSTTPAYGTDLFFLHKFRQKGRSLSFNLMYNYSERWQDRNVENTYMNVDSNFVMPAITQRNQYQFIANENINNTSNIRFSYTEPVGKFTVLEASYARNISNTKSLRDVNDIDAVTGDKIKNLKQSNDYAYTFTTNRYGLSLHYNNKKKFNFLAGIVAQPSTLTGMDKGRSIGTTNERFNIAPNARLAYTFSRQHSLTVTYGGTSREPSFMQLQPVSDSSNIKNIVTGNANLNAEFTNRFSLQYNKNNVTKGTTFFANVSFDETNNKIVSSRVNESNGTGRTTTFLNTDGFYGFNGNVSITQPFLKKKLVVTLNSNGSFDNNISFTDNQKNTGHNWTVRPGWRIRVDIPDKVDLSTYGSYYINKNTTTYPTHVYTSKVNTLTLGLDGKNYFFKDYTLGYDVSKSINKGFISSANVNPTILNMYVERRFLKNNKGLLKLQGYDLFNENTGISREINGTTVTDFQNNRLGRYFLLTFNLRLQKFTGRAPNMRQGQGQGGGQRNGGGGGNRGNGRD